MRKLIIAPMVLLFMAALAPVLGATAPALASGAIPLNGTFDGFTETCGPLLPTSGELGCLVEVQINTNLGPVTRTVELPFSTIVLQADGGVNFQGLGTWDFGNGDLLHTNVTGILSFGSGIVQIHEEVVGGEGIYEGATGTIHVSQFGPEQAAFAPLGGFIEGVINLN